MSAWPDTNSILPHLRSIVFLTGAFCTAWAWDLVFYGVSHVVVFDENPLQDQLSFGRPQHAEQPPPKYSIFGLLLQYLIVCGGAAVLSDVFCQRQQKWSRAAVVAVEFVPSPVFAGKLMAYLGQFEGLRAVERALINLAATLLAAVLAHVVVPLFTNSATTTTTAANSTTATTTTATTSTEQQQRHGLVLLLLQQYRLQRFPIIVQNTLGFGLGIAWNVLLGQFAPQQQHHQHQQQWSWIQFVALVSYLLVVTLLAFRLAATAKEAPETVAERLVALGAFAMYVVVAFTLVVVLNTILAPGWVGAVESLVILWLLSAVMSAMVATVDLDDISEQVHETLQHGPVGGIFRILVCVPCVWCCCPWVLVLWLLAGATENIGVREQWCKVIAMTAGLAASIEASGMLTEATGALAGAMGICTVKNCQHKWLFVFLQTCLAVLATLVLIPSIAPLSDCTVSTADASDEEAGTRPGERQSLLGRFRQKR